MLVTLGLEGLIESKDVTGLTIKTTHFLLYLFEFYHHQCTCDTCNYLFTTQPRLV